MTKESNVSGMEKNLFNSSFGIKLTPEQIVQTISDFIKLDPNREYKIIVGTDSEKRAGDKADFVTAIVVHRVGNGGRYFWRHIEGRNIHTLRDRMWREVLTSLEISKELAVLLRNASLDKYAFEVHVDVGENGATRTMIQELIGAVRANNFEAKTKPESFAASKVADRHV
ncbi:MAG: ribonuclease H-like YkuK family protein [Candidatus Harrisonbacteria bacterium]|nr:ribonuclease H-like YkuK family protein [Candidatus Harrisonbacteria bacterium]